MLDVKVRLDKLNTTRPELSLYALADGMQFEIRTGRRLRAGPGMLALFDSTADAALAHAGPWLIDCANVDDAYFAELEALEREAFGVVWLIAPQNLCGLAQVMRLHLDVRLPDGRTALLRFWDPRVLVDLVKTLDVQQRDFLFGQIHEWHLLLDGQRVWIGREHADAN